MLMSFRFSVSMILLLTSYPSMSIAKIIPVVERIDATFNSKLSNSSIIFLPDKMHSQTPRYNPTFTISINTFRTIGEASIHVKVTIAMKKGQSGLPIFDSTIDFCDLVRHPQKHHLISLIYYEVRRYGSVPQCPVPPGLYVLANVSLKQTQLPSYLSESDYVIEINGYTSPPRDRFCAVKASGSLKRF